MHYASFRLFWIFYSVEKTPSSPNFFWDYIKKGWRCSPMALSVSIEIINICFHVKSVYVFYCTYNFQILQIVYLVFIYIVRGYNLNNVIIFILYVFSLALWELSLFQGKQRTEEIISEALSLPLQTVASHCVILGIKLRFSVRAASALF